MDPSLVTPLACSIVRFLTAPRVWRADEECGEQGRDLQVKLSHATGEYHAWLEDRLHEAWANASDQKRFLRNMATIALATRLIHALRGMLRTADMFTRRKPNRNRGKSELLRFWTELGDTYALNTVTHADLFAFATPLNDVRNQIVHDGGIANPQLPVSKWTLEDGYAGMYDMRFSTKYPEYVDGLHSEAEVNVSMEQLERFGEHADALLEWVATELRAKQVAFWSGPPYSVAGLALPPEDPNRLGDG